MYTMTATGPDPALSPRVGMPRGTAGAAMAPALAGDPPPVAGAALREPELPPEEPPPVPLPAAGVMGREPLPLPPLLPPDDGLDGRLPGLPLPLPLPPGLVLGPGAGAVGGRTMTGGATGVAGAEGGVMIGFGAGRPPPLEPPAPPLPPLPRPPLLPFPPLPPLPRPLFWAREARSAPAAGWAWPAAACVAGAPRAMPEATRRMAPDAAVAAEMRRDRLLTCRL